MKQQYEFKKFPILATIIAGVCLLFAVIGVTASLTNYEYYYTGPMVTGLFLVIASVLAIAGLTTGRPILLKVISIIISISVIVTNFVLTVAEFGEHRVALFGVALLMLIASVLTFVYYLTVKTERIKKMFLVSGSILSGLTLVYMVIYTIVDLTKTMGQYDYYLYPYYFVLISYAAVTALPMVIFFSLTKKEEAQEEPKQIEEKAE